MGNTRPPFCSSLTTRSIRWDPWDPHEEDDRFVCRSIKTAEGKCKLVHRLIWRNLYLRWLDFNLYHSWFDQRRHSFIRRVFRIVTVFIPQPENCYSLVIWYWPINNQIGPAIRSSANCCMGTFFIWLWYDIKTQPRSIRVGFDWTS